MKKILFLINTLNGGGAEKVLLDLVNSLPYDKFDVTLQTIVDEGVYQNQINTHVHYKSINRKKGFFKKVFNRLLCFYLPAKYIYNKFVKDDYDIEIAFLEGLPTKIISASTNKKAKKIAWVHIDLMEFFDSSNVYRNFEENKKAYERFDKIACVSDAVKDKFVERFGGMEEKLETVYNIILDDDIRRKGDEPLENIKHDHPIIISCGRLCEQKGFIRLLHIHKKLLDKGIKHYLWIVGEGDLRKEFECYINDNNLQDTVKLWGFQTNPYKFMKNADLFACSSLAEGYSMVISESVILGTPVISTEVTGAREPKEHPRCYKIAKNDEDSLYIGIKEILQGKELEQAKEYTIAVSGYLKKADLLKGTIDFLGE